MNVLTGERERGGKVNELRAARLPDIKSAGSGMLLPRTKIQLSLLPARYREIAKSRASTYSHQSPSPQS